MNHKAHSDKLHKLPNDFGRVIETDAKAKALWEKITPLARNEWICWIISAKKDETRNRRIMHTK